MKIVGMILKRNGNKPKDDAVVSYISLPGLYKKYNFPESQKYNARKIEEMVCEYFGETIEEIRNGRRYRRLVICRHTMMFLMRRYTPLSLKDIGIRFGVDHTTVIHGITSMYKELETNTQFRKQIEYLESKLQ